MDEEYYEENERVLTAAEPVPQPSLMETLLGKFSAAENNSNDGGAAVEVQRYIAEKPCAMAEDPFNW